MSTEDKPIDEANSARLEVFYNYPARDPRQTVKEPGNQGRRSFAQALVQVLF